MSEVSQVRRVAVRGVDSFVRVGPRSISLGRDEDVLNWDRAGRPFAGNLEGLTWHRALDGGLVRIDTDRGARRATWLAPDDVARWGAKIRAWAEATRDALVAADDAGAAAAFEPAAAFDGARWAADAARFTEVYAPVPILPPDQYLALVLQATLGCSYNACTFCDFYKGRRYAVRPGPEFRAHAAAVRAFMGAGLAARRTIFLGDANAIAAPAGRVLEWLDAVRESFPVRMPDGGGLSRAPDAADPPAGFDGIHAFVDVPSALTHDEDDWAEFARRGLRTVYVGVETGSDRVLGLLGKPGGADAVRGLVPRLKRAGMNLGLIFLAGVGGAELAAEHEDASAALCAGLPLDRADLLYVSPFVPGADARLARREREAGLTPVAEGAAWEQARRLKERLLAGRGPNGPRGAIYDIRLFAY